jgi:hypothetical protein
MATPALNTVEQQQGAGEKLKSDTSRHPGPLQVNLRLGDHRPLRQEYREGQGGASFSGSP